MRRRPGCRAFPAKRRRRLSSGTTLGFSPFFRSLSRHLSRPALFQITRTAAGVPNTAAGVPKDEGPAGHPLPSKHYTTASHGAAPRPPESSSEGVSDLDEDEDDEKRTDTGEDTVHMDIDFFDPKPGDFDGVKLLLRNYLGDEPWDLGGFVDLILEQTTVGTVVNLSSQGEDEDDDDGGSAGADEDDDGPYAVITVLNLGRYASHQCINEWKKYLIKVCHEDVLRNKLRPMLEGEDAHNTGLLVCRRFVNFPYQPVPHLYDSLFDEVSWATEDEATQELRDSFRFKFYLLLARIFVASDTRKGRTKVTPGKKKRSSDFISMGCESDESIVYTNAEDEIFHKLCSISFTFDISLKKQFVPPKLKNYKEMGLVMVVDTNKIPAFREEVKSLVYGI